MAKQLLIFLIFIFLPIFSNAEFVNEVYVLMDMNWDYSLDQTASPNYSYSTGNKFLGGLGIGGGYKGILKLGGFGVGLTGSVQWKEEALSRKALDSSATTNFDLQTNRWMIGALVEFKLNEGLGVVLEYLPYVKNKVIYSDDGSDNPWRDDDVMDGKSLGAGFGYQDGPLAVTLLYRIVTYDKMDTNSVSRSLPDSVYSEFKAEEIVFQLGFRI